MHRKYLERFCIGLIYVMFLFIHTQSAAVLREKKFYEERRRFRRGVLSRTGMCPVMQSNFQKKDNRLNFFGQAVVIPGEEVADCFQSDCSFDGDCEGDHKCCRNNCGTMVCTEAVRAPHPCELIKCPEEMICKIERVHCQMPFCPDIYARSRPSCVQKQGYYAQMARKRSNIPQPIKIVPPGPSEVHFIPKEPYGEAPIPFIH